MDGIEKVVVNLLNNHGVFYASLLSQMKRIMTEQVPTAGVTVRNGRIELYWNPKFLDPLSAKAATAVLEHECMHLVMEHIARKRNREMKLWNIAADLAINQLIQNLPKDCVTMDKFPKEWKLPIKTAAEVYYQIFEKHQQKIEISSNGKGGMHVKIKNPDGSTESEFDLNDAGDHKPWEKSDGEDTVNEVLKQAVKHAVEQTERQQGHMPYGIEEYINELLKPAVVPWQVLLKRFVAMTVKAGHKMSWKRPNRRYGDEQKGKLANRKLALTIAIDTSGSIGNDDFTTFISEIRDIQRSYKSDVTVLECDAEVQKEYKLTPFAKVDTKFKGRGGTSFKPVFEYIQEKRIKTDVLVYFTDMYGDFPEKRPSYPTLWISVTDNEKAPWGTVISIPKHSPKQKLNKNV